MSDPIDDLAAVYKKSLVEIREALGLSSEDDHELVLDEILRLRETAAALRRGHEMKDADSAHYEELARAEIERLRAERDKLAEFAREFIRENCWDDYHEPDGGDVQDRAIALGILVEVEGGYDPEKHGCDGANEWGAEKGDPYYTFAPFVSKEASDE